MMKFYGKNIKVVWSMVKGRQGERLVLVSFIANIEATLQSSKYRDLKIAQN